MSTSKTYDELRKINVNQHVEKKNNLSYLSWAWAVDVLFQHDPEAQWDYKFFDGKPWLCVGETYMVFCTVLAFGRARTAQLPIMDYKNQALAVFTSFDLNTTMQRCLAKAISLHGIGLYIYAGEDLPEGEEKQSSTSWEDAEPLKAAKGIAQNIDQEIALATIPPETLHALRAEAKATEGDFYTISAKAATERYNKFKKGCNQEEIEALWSFLDSKVRNGMKRINDGLVKEVA